MAKDERCQCFCTKVAEWGMGDVVAKNGRCQCFCTKESERGWVMGGVVAKDERCQCFCTKVAEWRMGDDGPFVRREQSGGWEVTGRLYEGSRAGYG